MRLATSGTSELAAAASQDDVRLRLQLYVESALEITDGNRTAAADLLRVSRQSLYAKLNRYGLEAVPARKPELDKT